MTRFFINGSNIKEEKVYLYDDEHNHLSKSLRMRVEEKLVACDGVLDYTCEIEEISKDQTICKILSKEDIKSEPSVKIFVYISATKGDKLELVTQKATELGVYKIIPFTSKRSIVKFDEKSKEKRKDRLQKIANEASKQSGRGIIPEVCDIIDIKNINPHEMSLVLYENEKDISLKDKISNAKFSEIAIVVGPEGGFDSEEILMLSNKGFDIVSLGKRILRAETAPIACISAIMYETDNLS